MKSKVKTCYLVGLVLTGLLLTACTANEVPDQDLMGVEGETVYVPVPAPPPDDATIVPTSSVQPRADEQPRDLFCPEYGSRAAQGAVPDAVIEKNRSEKVLAMSGGAKVHVKAGVTVNADVVVCGGGATLILEGTINGRILISGGGPRLILVNGVNEPAVFWLDGSDLEVIRCPEQTPCERYF